MKIFENSHDLDGFLKNQRNKGLKIALIPTMGSIHKGHKSLIKISNKLGFFSVVTIFVNPTQFDNSQDYENYPRNNRRDINLLKKIDTNLLFFPQIRDLYPRKIKSKKSILEFRDILCDRFRPGHFDGVTTVVKSLFNLINPDYAFFGEKDYQQLKLIKKLVEKENLPIFINSGAAIRMTNGMSISSRYNNFNIMQKNLFNESAKIINNNLSKLRKKIDSKYLKDIEMKLNKISIDNIDYIEIRDEKELLLTSKNNNARLFIAYYIDNIRIIDNFILY